MKTIKTLVIICFLLKLSNIYALSQNFEFVIDTIGIPKYNSRFQLINEDIYYTYNVFAYSDPVALINNPMQRFKKVINNGKWTLSNGKYVGYGERGEYYLLGESYSGSPISNVYFPVDAIPESTPDRWVFIDDFEAYKSWQDKSKYKYIEQLEYMKNADLLFDYIDIRNGICDSYNLVSYNINVNKIGIYKMKLDTCSTWKTNGIVTAKRVTPNNFIRYAIFTTAPIEAKAEFYAKLLVDNNYVLESPRSDLEIPIKFGAKVVNMTNTANAKHIKEIVSILYIDGVEIDRISGNKVSEIVKIHNYKISREKYKVSKTYPINIEIKSYLYTEFNVDGLMQNNINKQISLQVKEENIIKILDVSIANIEKVNENFVFVPFIETLNSKEKNSKGITEKGRYAAIKIKKGSQIKNLSLKINNTEISYDTIYENNDYLILKCIINKDINNTIESWNYIRNKTLNYFDINKNFVGDRIKDPNILEVFVDNKSENLIYFDTIDEFTKNTNFSFSNNVINQNKLSEKKSVEEWMKYEK